MPVNGNDHDGVANTSQPTEEHHLVDLSEPGDGDGAPPRYTGTRGMFRRHQTQIAIIIVGVVCFMLGLGMGALIWHGRQSHTVTEPWVGSRLMKEEDSAVLSTPKPTALDDWNTTLPFSFLESLYNVTNETPTQITSNDSYFTPMPIVNQTADSIASGTASSTGKREMLLSTQKENSTTDNQSLLTTQFSGNITPVHQVNEGLNLTVSDDTSYPATVEPATVTEDNAKVAAIIDTSIKPEVGFTNNTALRTEVVTIGPTEGNTEGIVVQETDTTKAVKLKDSDLSTEQTTTTKNIEIVLTKPATRIADHENLHVAPKPTTMKSTLLPSKL